MTVDNRQPPSALYRWVNFSGASAMIMFAVAMIGAASGIPFLLSIIPFETKGAVREQFAVVNLHLDQVDDTLLSFQERLIRTTLSQQRRDELALSEKVKDNPGDIQGRDYLADLQGEISDNEKQLSIIHCQQSKRSASC